MSTTTAADIRQLILARFADPLKTKRLRVDAVPDDYDLLAEGLIDSLGILELFAEIEEQVGFAIDYENLPADQLTVVGPLSRFVAGATAAASGDATP